MKNRSASIIHYKIVLQITKALIISDIISGVLIVLFLYTSLNKLADHEVFKDVLEASPLLQPFAAVITWLLPTIELVIAVFLFIPPLRSSGLYASFILISIFTFYLVYMISFTPYPPCSCGGVLKFLTWKQHIFFNVFFTLLSLAGILLDKRGTAKHSTPPP